ncbi:hypothetical protein [Synechococcus sp. CBW1004]|uniref:hypothetical protein n=1 Tax=Synechococcus sp. CBW1004 TaxID=1353136 RepID=UPI001E65E15D|nr:hypothetical protein [Synechococcus sp. CBW1004]
MTCGPSRGWRSTGSAHSGGQACQPCCRFSLQSRSASSRLSSYRRHRCADGCAYSSGTG